MSARLLFGRTEELYSLLDSSKGAEWIMSFTEFIINQTWTIETHIIGKFSQFSQGQDFVFRNSGRRTEYPAIYIHAEFLFSFFVDIWIIKNFGSPVVS